MIIINNQEQLIQACQKLLSKHLIAIDTEFFRRDTYYAKPSLIQIKSDKYVFIIDVLNNLDLESFKEILISDKILKIFHAPREDFEIFYHLFKQLPHNIFDIQIAASICDLGQQLSYSDICNKICHIKINKSYQKANWLHRPLSQNMLDYAVEDVKYLEHIYQALQHIITKNKLDLDYNTQIQKLLDVSNYQNIPENAWKKIKFNNKSKKFISRIKILAAYREEKAKQINIPRRHFITDEDLLKICDNLPITYSQLIKLKIKNKYLANQKYAEQIVSLCNALN